MSELGQLVGEGHITSPWLILQSVEVSPVQRSHAICVPTPATSNHKIRYVDKMLS